MPGLFSWKLRFRTRKISENSERNLTSESLPSSNLSQDYAKPTRVVHFKDTAAGDTKHLNGPVNTVDWKYADDIQVPLAASEEAGEVVNKDEHHQQYYHQQQQYRQTSMPQESNGHHVIVEAGGVSSEPRVSSPQPLPPKAQLECEATPPPTTTTQQTSRTLDRLSNFQSVVYLEFNDEVKRALLPPVISSLDTIRALFLRSFPHLTSQYLSLPHVKIYIQEPSKGQLFYELDDLRDICDRAVLKLREQLSGFQSPQPIRFTDHPPLDYLSESDMLDYRASSRLTPHRMRPASAIDSRIFGNIKNARSPIPPNTRYDAYYSDPYASDTSSQDARSGSVTPIIDKEARFRMETMERQLAGLSSLVHSALITKGISETSQRDMQDLRMQILALHPDVSSSEGSAPESTEQSLPDSIFLSGETQQQFQKLRHQVTATQGQLKQMRRLVQLNNQDCRDILRSAFDRLQVHVAKHFGTAPQHMHATGAESLKLEHNAQIQMLQRSLQTFEEDVEEVRRLVLNTNRKLRMNEVETFTQTLTKIGRNAAKLKSQFPTVQHKLEHDIKANMERIVRDEKYIKEESNQLDQCLRRCKTLANMMVTMKKLAMVQDPSLNAHARIPGRPLSRQSPAPSSSSSVSGRHEYASINNNNNNTNGFSHEKSKEPMIREADEEQPPPLPPTPVNYKKASMEKQPPENTVTAAATTTNKANSVLDTILDELTSSVEGDRNKSKSPSSVRSELIVRSAPPKPPERYSTIDVRSRFTPSEVRDMQRQALNLCVSPIQGTQPANAGLDKRQEMLVQKQKQLHSQFEQLQQICAPSNIL